MYIYIYTYTLSLFFCSFYNNYKSLEKAVAPNVALTPLALGKAGPLSPSVPSTSHPGAGEPPAEEANSRPRKRRATGEVPAPGAPEAPGGPCPPAVSASKQQPPLPPPPPLLLPPPEDKDSEVEIEVESRDECKSAKLPPRLAAEIITVKLMEKVEFNIPSD